MLHLMTVTEAYRSPALDFKPVTCTQKYILDWDGVREMLADVRRTSSARRGTYSVSLAIYRGQPTF